VSRNSFLSMHVCRANIQDCNFFSKFQSVFPIFEIFFWKMAQFFEQKLKIYRKFKKKIQEGIPLDYRQKSRIFIGPHCEVQKQPILDFSFRGLIPSPLGPLGPTWPPGQKSDFPELWGQFNKIYPTFKIYGQRENIIWTFE
jgi:hypothetical protein